MDLISNLGLGFDVALTPVNIFYCFVGVLLGTYSSIAIAAPALLEIEKRYPHEQKSAKRPRSPAAKPSRV